jgi:hypothetical protein
VIRTCSQLTTTLRQRIETADQGVELLNLEQKTLEILFRHHLTIICRDPDN